MADIVVDLTGEESGLQVENPTGFDFRITGGGLSLDITHDQGRTLFQQLGRWFGTEESPHA